MQSLRWPRLAARLIDFAPLAVAILLVTPLLMALGLVAYESLLGVGIFDPTTGGDPVLTAHLSGQHPLGLGVLIGALGWVAVEALMLAQGRASVGQSICGLLVQRHDEQPAALARCLLSESLHQTLALALLVTPVLAALPGSPARPTGMTRLPRRYADYSPNPPLASLISAEHLAPLTLAFALALAFVLIIDLVLILAGARSHSERLAGTTLRRR
jgi:hypothetical protein